MKGVVAPARNGYGEDMEEMWTCDFDNVVAERDVTGIKTAKLRMAWWGHGRLYDSADVVAYEFKDGWYTAYDEEAEWCVEVEDYEWLSEEQ